MLILHGDNNILSRQALIDTKALAEKNHQNILEYSGADITILELLQSTKSTSLFGENNLVILTDFFARRAGKEKTLIVDYLKTQIQTPIVMWESKDVSTQLANFPLTIIRKYELSKFIFKFLDNFTLDLYHQSLTSAAPEQILALLSKRLHDLILAKMTKLPSSDWKTQKLVTQAKSYDIAKLFILEKELLDIDYAQKTSAYPYDLTVALELWVVKAL